MKIFTDNAGRTWTVGITVYAVKRVRARLNIDINSLVDENFESLSKFVADPVSLIDTLYVLCEDQAEKLGVSDEDFGRAMWGDALGHAEDAFLEALTDFFRDPRVRTTLQKVLTASRRLRDVAMETAMRRLDEIDLEAEVARLSGSSGSSPGSSASTPVPSPSGSSGPWLKAVPAPGGGTRRRSSRS